MKRQASYYEKPGTTEKKWYVVDAEGQILGRLASEIAKILRGKNKPQYTPSVDVGDFVVVINAEKVALSGNKKDQKKYYRHTGYPGGLKETGVKEQLASHPERLLQFAITGMLPKNRLGRQMLKKVKIYAGSEHPHSSQNPEPLTVGL